MGIANLTGIFIFRVAMVATAQPSCSTGTRCAAASCVYAISGWTVRLCSNRPSFLLPMVECLGGAVRIWIPRSRQ
jgi:hypothetical protein